MPVKYVSGDNDGRVASKVKILTSDTETVSSTVAHFTEYCDLLYIQLYSLFLVEKQIRKSTCTHTYTHTD